MLLQQLVTMYAQSIILACLVKTCIQLAAGELDYSLHRFAADYLD